jgi:cytochrome c553
MNKLQPLLLAALSFMLALPGALAAGDPAAGQQKSATCAACHGPDGNSPTDQYPKIAGQNAGYLVKQLREFKEGVRVNAIMSGMVAALSEQDMEDLAAFYESQAPDYGTADPELAPAGEGLYRGGDLARGIPACAACHGPAGLGNPAALFPRLSGQYSVYTDSQLKAFRSMQRANDAGQMMRNVAAKLSDGDIQALSSYTQGLRQD